MTGSIFFFFVFFADITSFYFTAGEREIRYGIPVQCDSRLACLESSVSSTGGTPHAQLSPLSFRSVTTEGGGVMKTEGRVRKGAGGGGGSRQAGVTGLKTV